MSTRDEKLKKLQKLQATRNGKKTVDREDDRLYDEVDEKEYRTMKYRQLLQDDFVEDDDGVGYVDRGVEDVAEYYSDEEIEEEDKDRKLKDAKLKNDGNVRAISDLLKVQRASAQLNKPKPKMMALDEFDDILGEFEKGPTPKVTFSHIKHKTINTDSSPVYLGKRTVNNTAERQNKRQKVDLEGSTDENFEMNSSPLKHRNLERRQVDDVEKLLDDVERSPTTNKESKKVQQISDNSDDESDDDITFGRRTVRSIAATRQVNMSSKSNPPTSPFVTAPTTPIQHGRAGISGKTPLHSSPEPLILSQNKLGRDQVINAETNSLQMYWLDFCEVDNTLVLFGKIKTLDGSMVSGMVQVNGICRELYFLPRKGKPPNEIHKEIIPLIMEKYGLDHIRAKPEKMKYAFELPDIPKETEYLKVLLPLNTPKSKFETIPPDLSSETFCHVFGGRSGVFESFVVQNKIMGPCWLEIKNADFTSLQNASNCAMELSVTKPQDITVLDIKKVPDLSGISLAIQTTMNVKENKQEVVALTISSYKKIALDSPIPEDLQPDDVTTLARPPNGSNFPVGLGNIAKEKLKGKVRLFNNEKTMLACFCAMLKVSDPDVIIGHRLESLHLDVLAHRIHDLNIPTFSALGRRARRVWPDRFGKNNSNMNHFLIQELLSGRLLCDIANDMGQSLTPKCQTWDLPEMYEITCGKEHKSLDINYQKPQYQEDADSLTMALQENIKNSMIIAEVSFRIQLLSLTKQLTNLAGNGWSQTLRGTRAGRNEYILLHEFARNGFILPDKENHTRNKLQQRSGPDTTIEEDSSNASPAVGSKKGKYQGGLVFEPEKGLHKNYVLVMDFNSLYPSIIQEFNICFTTVQRNLADTDELPGVPPDDSDHGVLPRLLANLVQRRREVKRIMATETDPHKRTQCDIKQQALKLTANSMYGCLGYVNSRFYAKPLAMLVTNKGREILMNTRQLAESLDLTVVYGDTDSVMIDSNCDNYADAVKVGNNFKKLVNERYKLLEIDIDNIFKKLLLHAKKKYAALNVSLDQEGKERTVLEVKGLDMKRREYCPLSRDVSVHILNKILSEGDSEKALSDVYEYLEHLRGQVQNNEIRIDKYKINTKLSKDPSAYPGGKNMPAVQVALRMRKGGRVVKAGAVITYVITKEDDASLEGNALALPVAERARALNEVMVKGSDLKPDPTYYLEKQIFAPVERLLGRIESFDIVRLSESLGLDSRRYINRENGLDGGSNGPNSLQPLETTISDVERFRDALPLEINCPQCLQKFPFGGIVASNHYLMCYNGLQCKHCNHLFAPLQLTCQLERTIRSHISLYYAGWIECDDPTCSSVGRQISVFGKRCLNEGCTGVAHYRYTDKQLYNQLLYFDSLFDCDKNKNQGLKPLYHEGDADFPTEVLADSSIKAVSEQNREYLNVARGVVQKYLSDCGRRYVDMSSIFDFMTTSK